MNNTNTPVSPDTTPELVLFTGHSNDIVSLAFSPDSKILATASRDKTVILWDTETGEMVQKHSWYSDWSPTKVLFSPDGHLLACADNNTLRLWDTFTGEPKLETEELWGSITFSPDGKFIIGFDSSESKGYTVVFWNISENKVKRTIQCRDCYSTESLSLSPDGKCLALIGKDELLLYNVMNDELFRTLNIPSELQEDLGFGTSIVFSPNGKLVAAANYGLVLVWDISSGTCIKHIQHNRSIEQIDFSPNSQTLRVYDNGGYLTFWDSNTWETELSIQLSEDWIRCFSFSPDGRLMAAGGNDRSVKILNSDSKELIKSTVAQKYPITSITWSTDGKTLVSRTEDSIVYTWDLHGYTLSRISIETASQNTRIVVSLDGSIVAVNTYKALELRRADTFKLLHTLSVSSSDSGYPEDVMSVAFSSDGKMLAIGHGGFYVTLWDVETGDLLGYFSLVGDEVTAIAFSPDGETLAVGTAYDDFVQLFSTKTFKEKRRLIGHTNSISSVAFSPNGKTLATASMDGSIKLWNPRNGKLLATLLVLPDENELSKEWVIYTPDGRWNGSPDASKFIRWQVGNDILPADAFPHRPV